MNTIDSNNPTAAESIPAILFSVNDSNTMEDTAWDIFCKCTKFLYLSMARLADSYQKNPDNKLSVAAQNLNAFNITTQNSSDYHHIYHFNLQICSHLTRESKTIFRFPNQSWTTLANMEKFDL